jgi:NADPH2:quinone reductase
VRIQAVGVNYIDIYHRSGLYPLSLPFVPGNEAAGAVDELGPGVEQLRVGDRVAYGTHSGSYADYAVVPAAKLVPVPAAIDLETAAAVMLQGMTAHYLCRTTFPIQRGHVALLHAAAGGVGLLLTQMLHDLGATVIGTVSTEQKANLARDAGAEQIVLYTQRDFETEVKRITANEGVDVVYDSVGKTTFLKGLNCLKPRGMMVVFGASSGNPDPISPAVLNQKGSLFLTRPSLQHHVSDRPTLLRRSQDVFDAIASRKLRVRIEQRYPLKDAAQAHRDLESRKTTGKLLLIPNL